MKSFVKWMDEAPLWLKIIFALPLLDVVWGVYRILKGVAYGKTWTLVFGILWIMPGAVICWLIDLVCIIIYREPKVFA